MAKADNKYFLFEYEALIDLFIILDFKQNNLMVGSELLLLVG